MTKFLARTDLDLIARAHQVRQHPNPLRCVSTLPRTTLLEDTLLCLPSLPNSPLKRSITFFFSASRICLLLFQVVEDGYEFFAKRQLVTVFSAPNYCGEFDNAGAMMSVDSELLCSFQVLKPADSKSNCKLQPICL